VLHRRASARRCRHSRPCWSLCKARQNAGLVIRWRREMRRRDRQENPGYSRTKVSWNSARWQKPARLIFCISSAWLAATNSSALASSSSSMRQTPGRKCAIWFWAPARCANLFCTRGDRLDRSATRSLRSNICAFGASSKSTAKPRFRLACGRRRQRDLKQAFVTNNRLPGIAALQYCYCSVSSLLRPSCNLRTGGRS
jgi:hypothetical protein